MIKKLLAHGRAFAWRWIKTPLIKISLIIVLVISLSCLGWLNYLDAHQIGIARNSITGEMWMQGPGGIYVTGPWVRVSRIDTRPMRLSIESAGRAYSGKLVQFQPEHWEQFVEVEGFRYWWWANRFSYNWGHEEEYRGVRNLLRGYAYSPKRDDYRFIVILNEYSVRE